MKLVSICIPVYNGEKYLRQCIESAIDQSYPEVEIIIVDDGSTDNSFSIIGEYASKEQRIKFFRNKQTLGLTGNWNRCIELASGSWIKFLFQDDYLAHECIEKMISAATDEHSLIVCQRTFVLSPDADNKTRTYYSNEVVTFEKLKINEGTSFIPAQLVSKFACEHICLNFIGEPTSIMFIKKAIARLGFFDSHIAQLCDLEFVLRIGTNEGLVYISEPLSFFRIHETSATSTNLKGKEFILRYLDPIITVRQLLYASEYTRFRTLITAANKIKLKQYFLVRVYEAYIASISNPDNKHQMEKVAAEYLEIKKYMHGNFLTKLKLWTVNLKRMVRSAV